MGAQWRNAVLGGWLLVELGRSAVPLGEFPSSCMCGQARNAAIAQEATSELEPAILALPGENPERQRAVARAERRVSGRYQCRLLRP